MNVLVVQQDSPRQVRWEPSLPEEEKSEDLKDIAITELRDGRAGGRNFIPGRRVAEVYNVA
jgi:hypothetical protein